MSDDLGWGEVGLYPSDSPHGRIATPHLDQFGREGMVFRHAYAGYTVCAPSRMSFFTGRHAGTFWSAGINGMSLKAKQLVNRTLGPVLRGAGYTTGLFGKSSPLESPERQGFDKFVGQVSQELCHNMYPRYIDQGDAQLNFNLTGNFKPKSRELCMASPELYNYTVDVFHASAMEWFEEAVRGPRPVFLYLGYTVPHGGGWADAPASPMPAHPVPSDLQYAQEPWPPKEKDHAAMITYLDLKIGDLMQRIKLMGVDSSTVVFFASDNGGHKESGHHPDFFDSNGGLRGFKRSLFEGGVRSPTMARWPGVIPLGTTSDFQWILGRAADARGPRWRPGAAGPRRPQLGADSVRRAPRGARLPLLDLGGHRHPADAVGVHRGPGVAASSQRAVLPCASGPF
ncbi:unnamed protein product [Prorocentrum cordatum]|uniref:Sulfatase N-terminal domain-containing protein n=1 Tax=Prorocentrum cordatum TaxID=2364126 RepID=A0ABN9PFX6_9DINO|nr:unnamed protein product [Polarella glacialis]